MCIDLAGTWRVKDNVTVENLHGHWIADTGGKTHSQLIAAAPELLEALQVLKRELVLSDIDLAYIESHFRPHIDRASAAIKKALGQYP